MPPPASRERVHGASPTISETAIVGTGLREHPTQNRFGGCFTWRRGVPVPNTAEGPAFSAPRLATPPEAGSPAPHRRRSSQEATRPKPSAGPRPESAHGSNRIDRLGTAGSWSQRALELPLLAQVSVCERGSDTERRPVCTAVGTIEARMGMLYADRGRERDKARLACWKMRNRSPVASATASLTHSSSFPSE
jgi:hypothetical protein